MMHRTSFDGILEACATTEPRMVAVFAVMQALLGELRRVGQAAFFTVTYRVDMHVYTPTSGFGHVCSCLQLRL